jgi:hypothetical protein
LVSSFNFLCNRLFISITWFFFFNLPIFNL